MKTHSCGCLERLLDAERYSSDAYGVYCCLSVNKRRQARLAQLSRNGGGTLRLRGKLNRLVRRAKGYSKADGMLTMSLALAWLKLGWI